MGPSIAAVTFLVAASGVAPFARQTTRGPAATATAMPRATDPRADQILKSISPDRILQYDATLVGFGSRVSLSEGTSTATRGAEPARKWIVSQFQAIADATGGRLKVSVDTFPVPKGNRIPADQTMSNVVAILPGTDPDDKRVFVVSGHYDSLPADFTLDAPGANDDASGTIVSLECARALSAMQFPATIEFLAVEGEEQGLYGSKHAADALKAAGANIAGMLNNDIVGGDQTPGRENRDLLRVFSQGVPAKATPQEIATIASQSLENDSPSREVARYASALAEQYLPGFHVVLEYRPDRFQRGGDEESFVDDGYAAVRFTEFNENSNHQHVPVREVNGVEMGDRQKWVSPAYIANVARVNALTLAWLASSPPPPEHVTFQAGQQATGTAVTWTAVPGAATYRVLLRPTADSEWTIRLPAPAVPAPPRGAGGGRGAGAEDTTGSGSASAGTVPPAADTSQASATMPAGPTYQATVPQSGDNYFIAIVAVDAAGHESLPRLAAPPPRGRRGGGAGGL